MQDAESFVAAAQGMKNVVVTEIKSAQIVERNGALNLGDVFAQEQAIPGIAKMHSLMEVCIDFVVLYSYYQKGKDNLHLTLLFKYVYLVL